MKKLGMFAAVFALAACDGDFGGSGGNGNPGFAPSVDYIEHLDVSRAEHNDSFMARLALNYRSFALFNARVVGDMQTGERFAQKAIAAFSGELPYPENPTDWGVRNPREFVAASDALIDLLRAGAPVAFPDLAAETQAKFDCWVAASATGLRATAHDCQVKFDWNMSILSDNMEGMTADKIHRIAAKRRSTAVAINRIPSPGDFMDGDEDVFIEGVDENGRPIRRTRTRDRGADQVMVMQGNLIRPEAVMFGQNSEEDQLALMASHSNFVSRDEFITIMLALREELAAIRAGQAAAAPNVDDDDWDDGEEVELTLKIQQIPLSPKQSIMEEIFEVRFDFNKSNVTPEYQEIIRKLAETAQNNKNVKITVVGHTDTVGSKDFNFALGGRRAESVRKLLVNYGIPSSQIVSVSSGMNDLKVQTGPNVKNAENRRVRVVKETTSMEVPDAPQTGNIRLVVDGDARVSVKEQ